MKTLVIGYGNSLRGDDALGHVAAEAIASLQIPNVEVIRVHQLVPELCDDIKNADRVLFIDAAIFDDAQDYHCERVHPVPSHVVLGHHETPGNVLALTSELYERVPEAWLLSIAACSFEHGASITPFAQANLDKALAWIRCFLSQQNSAISG